MKLRFSSLHARVGLIKTSRNGFCAALLAASAASLTPDAGAAPKGTPTPPPAPTTAATATPLPTATPAATTAPATPAPLPNYNGQQQSDYIATARNAFVALRTEKSQPFLDAHKELDAAGGISAKGLKSKEDIAARRALVAKNVATNEDYLNFVKTQEDTYKAELAKTPLIPDDVNSIVADFSKNSHTAVMIKLRETEREALKAGDDMLAGYEKRFGAWTVSDAGKVTFKKKTDVSAMNALNEKFNARVKELQPLREQLTAAASPSPSPGAAGTAAVPAVVPGPAPVASPAGTAKP